MKINYSINPIFTPIGATGHLVKLIGRYDGLTGKTWVEGVGNKFLLVGNFWASKKGIGRAHV